MNLRDLAIGFGAGVALSRPIHLFFKMLKDLGSASGEKKMEGKKGYWDCLLFTDFQPVKCALPHLFNACSFEYCRICNFKRLLEILKSASHHIDICVYLITENEICELLKHLLNQGVTIRVIMDKQMSQQGTNCKVLFFHKANIPIKMVDTPGIMHNKFVLIDRRTLVTGSFNWTHQGVNSNFENAVITSDSHVVSKFFEYFETLWVNSTST